MFNSFYLDYFVTFFFGFGLSVHFKLTLKSGDHKLLRTCVDKYSEGQFGLIRYCKLYYLPSSLLSFIV